MNDKDKTMMDKAVKAMEKNQMRKKLLLIALHTRQLQKLYLVYTYLLHFYFLHKRLVLD